MSRYGDQMKQASIHYLTVIACLVGFSVTNHTALAQSTDEKKATAPAVMVTLAAKKDIAEQHVYFGRVDATERVEIRARIDGYLGPLAFEQGSFVKEGDLLFQIEKDLYQAYVDQARANLASATAAVKLAKVQLDRSKELVGRSVVSQATLDENIAIYEEAQATVKAREADLKLANINLGYTDIVAPISGRIGKATENKGSLVGPSSDPLALLVAQDPIQVAWPIPDSLFTQITRQHQSTSSVEVKLRLPDGSDYGEAGKIIYTEPSANATTNTITVRAEFPNPDFLLVDQQLITVVIDQKEKDEQLVIPQTALLLDQQGAYVMAVDDKNTVEIRRITTGEQRGTFIIVKDGLKEGTKVIVSGLQKVRKGMAVTPEVADSNKAKQ